MAWMWFTFFILVCALFVCSCLCSTHTHTLPSVVGPHLLCLCVWGQSETPWSSGLSPREDGKWRTFPGSQDIRHWNGWGETRPGQKCTAHSTKHDKSLFLTRHWYMCVCERVCFCERTPRHWEQRTTKNLKKTNGTAINKRKTYTTGCTGNSFLVPEAPRSFRPRVSVAFYLALSLCLSEEGPQKQLHQHQQKHRERERVYPLPKGIMLCTVKIGPNEATSCRCGWDNLQFSRV